MTPKLIPALAALCVLSAAAAAEAQSQTKPVSTPPAGDYLTLEQLREKYREPGAKFMTIKGVEVYYQDEGQGPAILMVHGSSSTLKTWDRIAEVLKAHYRVIRYDVPPGGLSGPVSDEVAAHVRPEDIPEALLTNLGVKSATVIGVSSGGTMGYFLAAKRPDMVERLVLSNTPADVVNTAPMKVSKALDAEQKQAGEAAGDGYKRRSFWTAFWDFFAGEPDRIPTSLRDQYYDINRKTPQKNRFALSAVVANHALTLETAAKVTCPVLLLWGERDPLLPDAAADVLASYLKNADLSKILLPDVGHYPPIEVPDRYAQLVAAYIEAATPVKPKAPPPKDR
jgi:pimeloyl-ACP methyl ester carboxylesterase